MPFVLQGYYLKEKGGIVKLTFCGFGVFDRYAKTKGLDGSES